MIVTENVAAARRDSRAINVCTQAMASSELHHSDRCCIRPEAATAIGRPISISDERSAARGEYRRSDYRTGFGIRPSVWTGVGIGIGLGLAAFFLVGKPALAGESVVLPDPEPSPPNSIGTTLAFTPDRLLVGVAERRSVSGPKTVAAWGAVLLWNRDEMGLPTGEPALLLPASPKRAERFGESISVLSTFVGIGSPGYDVTATKRAGGRVRLYSLESETPALLASLVPPTPMNGLEFGASVAIAAAGPNGRVIVGAPGYRDPSTLTENSRGRVWIFDGADNTWPATAAIDSPLPANSRFGISVATVAGFVIVGAPGGGDASSNPYGRVFAWPSGDPTAKPVELAPPSSLLGDRFGWSLAAAGTLVAVGAPADDCDAGAVHLYRLGNTSGGSGWNHEATLVPPPEIADGWRGFGNSIALTATGDAIVVGSGGISQVEGDFGHRVAVYRRVGNTWVVEATSEGTDPETLSATAVAIDTTGFAFADPAASSGAVVFESLEYSELVGDLDGDGTVGATDLALLLGAWGPSSSGSPADLNGDGEVGPQDLAILLGAWSFVGGIQ